MTTLMRGYLSRGGTQIHIFNVLKQECTVCISNGIHKGAGTYIQPSFLSGSSQEELNYMLAPFARSALDGTDDQTRSPTRRELVPLLLIRYAHEDTLFNAYEQFPTYTHAAQQDRIEYGKKL